MRRIHVLGLCVVAGFALSAVVSVSASAALPEYKACIKAVPKNTGKYNEKTCSASSFNEAGSGKYERAAWNKGKGTAFKAKSAGPLRIAVITDPRGCKRVEPETERCQEEGGPSTPAYGAVAVECKSAKVTGAVTGPNTTTWQTDYKGCGVGSVKCSTKGQKAGTIVSDQLESTLVNLDKGPNHKHVGIRVKGLGPDGLLVEYECNGPPGDDIYGETLAQVNGNLNSAAKDTEIAFNQGPLALPTPLYEEEAFTEEAAKSYLEWSSSFENCVAREVGKGVGKAEAESNCSAELGAPPTPRPISLIDVSSEWTRTAWQYGVIAQKGESMLVEDN